MVCEYEYMNISPQVIELGSAMVLLPLAIQSKPRLNSIIMLKEIVLSNILNTIGNSIRMININVAYIKLPKEIKTKLW